MLHGCEKAENCGNRVKLPKWKYMWKGFGALVLQLLVNFLLFVGGIWFGLSLHTASVRSEVQKAHADRDVWKKAYESIHDQANEIQAHFDKSDVEFRKHLHEQLDRIEDQHRKGQR